MLFRSTVKVLVEGKHRAQISRYVETDKFFSVEVENVPDELRAGSELEALVRSINSTFEAYVRLNKKIPPEMVMTVASIEDPSRLADTIVSHLGIKLEDKQQLLETFDVGERLEKVLGHMRSEMEILEVEKRIRSRVKKQMEKTQKEYYLNEQMRAIQKELGEKDEFKNEIQELEERLAKLQIPDDAREKLRNQRRGFLRLLGKRDVPALRHHAEFGARYALGHAPRQRHRNRRGHPPRCGRWCRPLRRTARC